MSAVAPPNPVTPSLAPPAAPPAVVLPACPTCAGEFRPGTPAARPQITSPEHAHALVAPHLVGRDREHCLLVSLDVKHRLLRVATISVGTVDHTFMAPREIFRAALLDGASAVFLAHNHPSGDATPSADDRAVTRRLAQAGTTLGVEVLDHLVIGDPDWVSLAREGVL